MRMKRIISTALAALLCCTAMTAFPQQTAAPLQVSAADGRLYNQWDAKWLDVTWDGYADTGNSMYTSACGIFSFCNAIYALNGIIPDAVEVAQWAYEIGAFRPGGGGTYRDILYANIEQKFGEKFHFKLGEQYFGSANLPQLHEHLETGGVAILHVPNHFIAITGYNPANQTYHVIESAVSSSRNLAPDSWVSGEKLCTGGTAGVWFITISNTKAPERAEVYLSGGSLHGANEQLDFVLDSDTRNTFALGIDDAEGKRLDTVYVHDYPLSSKQHAYYQLAPGEYSCYATAANDFGNMDSPRYSFRIYEGAPESAKLKASAERSEAGKPLTFTFSGGLSVSQILEVYRNSNMYAAHQAEGVLDSKNSALEMTYTPKLPGFYDFTAVLRNSYGAVRSEKVSVFVAGDVPITLDAAGGTLPQTLINVPFMGKYGKLPVPERKFWQFDGWFTEKEGGVQVTEDTVVNSSDAHTLYAHWTKIHQRGDLSGDDVIDVTDAQLVMVEYLRTLTGAAPDGADAVDPVLIPYSDIDGDGTLTPADAQLILLYYIANTLVNEPKDWDDLLNPEPETTTAATTTSTTVTTTTTTTTTTFAATVTTTTLGAVTTTAAATTNTTAAATTVATAAATTVTTAATTAGTSIPATTAAATTAQK